VIHVIHYAAAPESGRRASWPAITTASAWARLSISVRPRFLVRISVDLAQQGYSDDRTDWERAHSLAQPNPAGGGNVRVDVISSC